MKKYLSILLVILLCFLALTAIGGGISLITGFGTPPVELLHNSMFSNYLIPGLVLLIIVGGSASVSCLLVLKKHKYGLLSSMFVAFFIIAFESVEIIVVGSPEGIARNLQIIYFLIGIVIGILSILLRKYS